MQIAYTSLDGRKLPHSMGYGLIDPLSIVENDGTLEANYISEVSNSVVHKVTWSLNSCQLETFNSSGATALLFQELTKQNYNAVIESFIGKLMKL